MLKAQRVLKVTFFFLHRLVFIILSVMDIMLFYVCGIYVSKNNDVNRSLDILLKNILLIRNIATMSLSYIINYNRNVQLALSDLLVVFRV